MDDAPPADSPTPLFRLIYRSRDLIPEQERRVGLGEIFSTARTNNKALDITGALLVRDDWFVQALEGEESAVRALYTRIELDPRHDAVSLLDARQVDERVFSRWAMARVTADGEPDIPLISNKKGITAAAARGTSSSQEGVLQAMRDAARVASPV